MRWFLAHRLILVIYIGGLTLAVFELNLPQDRVDYLANPDVFLRPETNIAHVSSVLYPERALTLYYNAYQASLCTGAEDETPPECRQRGHSEPGEVRELIERSLATGNRSIEMAMYNYAVVLIQENASPELIDAAIRNWRVSYPDSSEVDLREMYRESIRQNRIRKSRSRDSATD
jgi:hypothetical protein